MQITPIAPVTMAALVSSSIPVNDAPAWNTGTAYAVGDRVLRDAAVSTYLIDRKGVVMPTVFEAVAAHMGKDPALAANVVGARQPDGTRNTAGPWARVGAAKAWRPFDGRQGDIADAAGSISYRIVMASQATAAFLFRLSAGQVRLRVFAASGALTFDATQETVDASALTDMWLYLTGTPLYRRTVAFSGFLAPSGSTVEITVSGSGTQKVGEIALGRAWRVGTLLVDAEVGYDDFTRVERDENFGTVEVIRRGFAERATFPIRLDTMDVERVMTMLTDTSGLPAVYHGGDDLTRAGLTVLGITEAPPFVIRSGLHATAQIVVKGLS